MRDIFYLDESVLLPLASSSPRKEGLIKALEDRARRREAFCTSLFSLSFIQKYFDERDELQKCRYFLRELKPLFQEILEPNAGDLERALELRELYSPSLAAARQAALMLNRDINRLLSFNTEYDLMPEITRIPPES